MITTTPAEHCTLHAARDRIDAALNEAARDGWEVVSVTADLNADGMYLIVLRRGRAGVPSGAVMKAAGGMK